jgi:catechol 2,3-dioxygenase-like lactoylglutathione lyase family enzyme
VTDLDRSRRFYRDLLGFHEIDSGRGNAVLASGDTRLVLRVVTEVSAVRARPVHLNLEVGDVNAMHAELAGQGARFVHGPRVVARGEKLELWAASLADPDGHSVDISQWRAVVD